MPNVGKNILHYMIMIAAIPFVLLYGLFILIICLPDIGNWDNYKSVVENIWHGG